MFEPFAYEILRIPDVMLAVTGRRFDGLGAKLEGHYGGRCPRRMKTGQRHAAQVYVVDEAVRDLMLDELWRIEQFTASTPQRFLRRHFG